MNMRLIFAMVIFFSLISLKAYNQTDSINVSYSQEYNDSSDFKYRRVYQYLDINMKNEKRLFKVSPGFSFSDNYSRLSFQLGYEWKLKKQFSISLNAFTLFERIKAGYYSYFGSAHEIVNHSTLGLDFRYYFTLQERMKNGISGNNLTGLYVGMGNHLLSYNPSYNSLPYSYYHQGFTFVNEFNPRFSLGLQKRLNNWSYIDVYTAASINNKRLNLNLGFNLGLAWGK